MFFEDFYGGKTGRSAIVTIGSDFIKKWDPGFSDEQDKTGAVYRMTHKAFVKICDDIAFNDMAFQKAQTDGRLVSQDGSVVAKAFDEYGTGDQWFQKVLQKSEAVGSWVKENHTVLLVDFHIG